MVFITCLDLRVLCLLHQCLGFTDGVAGVTQSGARWLHFARSGESILAAAQTIFLQHHIRIDGRLRLNAVRDGKAVRGDIVIDVG